MDINPSPRHEGVRQGPESSGDSLVLSEDQLSSAATLAELSREYFFFNHGLLFTHGFMPNDPIGSFDHIDVKPVVVESEKPFFRHLSPLCGGDPAFALRWNHVVVALPLRLRDVFIAQMSGVAGVNRETRHFFKAEVQELDLVDTIAYYRNAVAPDVVPTFKCLCVAVMANTKSSYFEPRHRRGPADTVPVVVNMANPEVVRFAKGVLAEEVRPLSGSLEDTPRDALAKIISGESDS